MAASLFNKRCDTCVRKHETDSWWSWLVLLCAFLSYVIITGSITSFGVFYPTLLREFKQDKAMTGMTMMSSGISYKSMAGFKNS